MATGTPVGYVGGTRHLPIPTASQATARRGHRPWCGDCKKTRPLNAAGLCEPCARAQVVREQLAERRRQREQEAAAQAAPAAPPPPPAAPAPKRRPKDRFTLNRALGDLEATDPAVAAAAAKLDDAVDRIVHREDHVDPTALHAEPADEHRSPAPQTGTPDFTPPRVATPVEGAAEADLSAQVLRRTVDADDVVTRMLRHNALAALEALHLYVELHPQAPQGGETALRHPRPVEPESTRVRARPAPRPAATPRRRATTRGVGRGRDRIQLPAAEIIEAYTVHGRTLADIAAEHGVSSPTVARCLDEHGVDRRHQATRVTPDLIEKVRSLYVDEHLNQAQVAERLDVTTKVIQTVMTKGGIETRPNASQLSQSGVGHPIKLTDADCVDIARRYQDGEPASALATAYDVSQASVYYSLKKQGITVRHGNRPPGSAADHAAPLKEQLRALGVTARQVKQWALELGMMSEIRRGLPGRDLVDAYAAAHARESA